MPSPLPQPLPKECLKAAKIFSAFVDSGNNGLDGVIPRSILAHAKGFAIFTVVKAGFILSARAGSGVVIAKLDDGSWSAPSAIGTAGVGFGTQAGAEMTDFLVVLNSRSAVTSFMSAGSLTFGGNMSIALGPLGRNGEATGALNTNGKMAAMYSYSKTRGLFGGVSLEGSVIVERQDANALAYNSPVTARMLLGGVVDRPQWALSLIHALETYTGFPGTREWIEEHNRHTDQPYIFGRAAIGRTPSSSSSSSSFFGRKKKQEDFPPASWITPTDASPSPNPPRSSTFDYQFENNYEPFSSHVNPIRDSRSSLPTNPFAPPSPGSSHMRSQSMYHAASRNQVEEEDASVWQADPPSVNRSKSLSSHHPVIRTKPELSRPLAPNEGVARAIALFDFQAAEPGDLSFSKGDVITVTKKSHSSDDWWTGKLNGRQGIFPANFVELA